MAIFIIGIVLGIIWGIIKLSMNNNALNDNISKQETIIQENDITIAKELTYRTLEPRWFWRFIVDDLKQNIHIIDANNNMVSIPYAHLLGCEVVQDNEVTGGIKRAIAGGIIAGGAGSIIGANTAKVKVTSFGIIIYQDDLSTPQIPITLIDKETKKNHVDYINACTFANEVTATIKLLIHRQEVSTTT